MAEAREKASRWHRLDNTANLFPVISSKKNPNVYRLSITLKEPVAPELLQQALEKVIPRFAAFKVRLRRGLFWHYLEANDEIPQIIPEDDYPCRVIDPMHNRHFLFRVSWFDKRINLEIYHALTDGTGGMQFLLALCCQYLLLAHPADFSTEEKARFWFAEHAIDTEDSYVQNYTPTKKASFKIGRGYRLKGGRNLLENLSVIHAHIPLEEILAFCRSKEVSITHYITACIAWGVYETQLKKRPSPHPLNIFIPVNLRKIFPSNTALNFFSNIYITLPLSSPTLTFDEVLAEVKKQFEEKVTPEGMLERISYTVGSGYSTAVRMVPLPLKKAALWFIFKQSARSSSMGFSNVGEVSVPEPFRPYVDGAAFILSAIFREPFKCGAVSCNGVLTVSFSCTLNNMALQKSIVRKMAADGLDITIESNGVDYESL